MKRPSNRYIVALLFILSFTSILAQDRKSLVVKKIEIDRPITAADVTSLMNSNNVEYHSIDQVNWKRFPHKPDVMFRIAHTGSDILLHYKVTESDVRAIALNDNGRVWEDSCVEFFVSPNGDDSYYNFEVNCIGKLLMQAGALPRRPLAKQEVLSRVQRWSSLGENKIEQTIGIKNWELILIIPKDVFHDYSSPSFDKSTMKGNFYKCGDKQKNVHYLSWSPIMTPYPNFHSSDYFGTLYFE